MGFLFIQNMYSCLPTYFPASVGLFFVMLNTFYPYMVMLFAHIFTCLPLDQAYILRISLLNGFLGDLHPFKGSCHLALPVIYIRLGGILLLSYFLSDLHLFKGSYHLASLVIYICLGRILLHSQYLVKLHPLLGFISNLHPSGRNFITQPIFR